MASASGKGSVGVILAIWGAGLGAAGQYVKVSVTFDRIGGLYPDAGAALGFVVSLVGLVGILLGVVAGLLVARIGYRRALLAALWAGAAISALEALLPPLPVMLGLRALEGLSHLTIVVAAPTLIAQLADDRHRGLALTLWSTFFGVTFTGFVLFGLPIVHVGGLSPLFLGHALWMAVFALVLGRVLTSLGAPRPDEPLGLVSILRDHGAIYRSPSVAAPGLGWLFYTFCFLAILTVLPPHLDPDIRNLVIGSMPLVSIIASMTLGVWLMRRITAVQVVQAGFAGSVAALVWLLAVPGSPAGCMALAVALGLIQGASFAAVPQLNASAAAQAQANGALAQMGNLGNTAGTPALLWVLSWGGYPALIWTAILVFAGGFAAHAWLALRRRLPRTA